MNIVLLLYEVNFELRLILELFYFFNIMLFLCRLFLNLFYLILCYSCIKEIFHLFLFLSIILMLKKVDF